MTLSCCMHFLLCAVWERFSIKLERYQIYDERVHHGIVGRQI